MKSPQESEQWKDSQSNFFLFLFFFFSFLFLSFFLLPLSPQILPPPLSPPLPCVASGMEETSNSFFPFLFSFLLFWLSFLSFFFLSYPASSSPQDSGSQEHDGSIIVVDNSPSSEPELGGSEGANLQASSTESADGCLSRSYFFFFFFFFFFFPSLFFLPP